MRSWLFLSVLLAAAAPALAQRAVTPPPELAEPPLAPPPGGIAVAGERMAVSLAACAKLGAIAEDTPGPDYVPGVDARGNPVAPADLPSAAAVVPDVSIEIGIELRRRYGIAAHSPLFRLKSGVGFVSVRGGRAFLDGMPLVANDLNLLQAACRAARGRGP